MRRLLATVSALAVCCGASVGHAGAQSPDAAPPAPALGFARVELQVDNDLFTLRRAERWYTSGVFLRGYRPVSAGGVPDGLADWWCRATAGCGEDPGRWVVFAAAQQLYTPATHWQDMPQPDDRPYAAWLFGSAALLIEDPRTTQYLALRAGVIGPPAHGEAAQNGVHRLLAQRLARGWQYQRRSMVGAQADYAALASRSLGSDLDVVGRFAATAGNVALQTSVGAVLRWGALPAVPTYPNHPTMAAHGSGSGRWHVYAGGELRLVGRDRLIDGPVTGYESRVGSRAFVPELLAGFSMPLVPQWQLDFTLTVRAPEFEAPHDPHRLRPQSFGTVLLRWTPTR